MLSPWLCCRLKQLRLHQLRLYSLSWMSAQVFAPALQFPVLHFQRSRGTALYCRHCLDWGSLWCIRRRTVAARRSVHGHSTAVIVRVSAPTGRQFRRCRRPKRPASQQLTDGQTDGRSCRKTRARPHPAHRTVTRRINLPKHPGQRLCDYMVWLNVTSLSGQLGTWYERNEAMCQW